MTQDRDRLLKRVWLVNGLLLLGLTGLALVGMAVGLVSELFPGKGAAVRLEADTTAAGEERLRAIRYEEPVAMVGTAVQLVAVHHGEAEQAPGLGGGYAGSGSGDSHGPVVNFVFLDPSQPAGRLLLDRPAYVRSFRYPAIRHGDYAGPEHADSTQTWISYEIAFADTNGDRTLDGRDATSLYVSALDGSGFRRITPDGLNMLSHTARLDRRSILVLALEAPRGRSDVRRSEMRQRAFVYDVPTATLRPFAALETPAARAAKIVGR